MKGIKHIFSRECKKHNVKILIGKLWQCKWDSIVVPEQKTDLDLFIGFHELGHCVLHKGDKRNYDDLMHRIEIEIEADNWANEQMNAHGYKSQNNDATLGLIALYIYQGGEYLPYEIKQENRFIVLYKIVGGNKFEIFSQFISNLPMHPTVY